MEIIESAELCPLTEQEREPLLDRGWCLTTMKRRMRSRSRRGSQRDCASYYRPEKAQAIKKNGLLEIIAAKEPWHPSRLDVSRTGC